MTYRVRKPASRRRGMSLLELIVSTAIFFLSLVAIYGLLDISQRSGVRAKQRGQALRVCQARLAELVAGVLPLESADGTDDQASDYQYQISVESEPDAAGALVKATVVAFQANEPRDSRVSLTQILMDPSFIGSLMDAVPDSAAASTTDDSGGTDSASSDSSSSGSSSQSSGGGTAPKSSSASSSRGGTSSGSSSRGGTTGSGSSSGSSGRGGTTTGGSASSGSSGRGGTTGTGGTSSGSSGGSAGSGTGGGSSSSGGGSSGGGSRGGSTGGGAGGGR